MRFDILTIFPEYFDVLNLGIIGKAVRDGKFQVNIVNIRDFPKTNTTKPTIIRTVAVRVWL